MQLEDLLFRKIWIAMTDIRFEETKWYPSDNTALELSLIGR